MNSKKNKTKTPIVNTKPKSKETLKIDVIKKNQSTKGKKNWKKIDITELQANNNKIAQEKLEEKNIQVLKDEDLFTVDTKPTGPLSARNKLLNKKKIRDKNYKKISVNEERKIKRIVENIQLNIVENKKIETKSEDIWGDDNKMNNNKSFMKYPPKVSIPIVYPKVPLPHPGQSYNPSKQDLSNLLNKVVEMNTKHESLKIEEKTAEDQEGIGRFPLSDDEESDEEYNEATFKVSNNPAIDDFTQRKTLKERKKSIRFKEHLQKEKDLHAKKENRIKLSSAIGIKKVERSRQKKIEEEETFKRKKLMAKREKEELIKIGVVEDADLLKDFQVKKEPMPLRKIKTRNSIMSDRFQNIIKRNVVGEFNHNHRVRSRANKKLNKFKTREGGINNIYDDYGYSMGDTEKLKIFE